MKNTQITQAKLELIRKIVNAHLTPAELIAVQDKAKEIIDDRNTRK